ncbi:hypothetical protein [Campylobacter phage CP21]|uniref:Uncharacterized protein n=1 Tax=Campylobacter phage CP21 TaxID=2881391 RepID=I7JVX0_9CAUD|nr:hypothetical protein F421_gp217 [Campylobacter phage CP21]CCH63679.1 hypothetical protein [Campylobacter phage CP21]
MKELLYYTKKYIANEKYKFCDEPYFESTKRKTNECYYKFKDLKYIHNHTKTGIKR